MEIYNAIFGFNVAITFLYGIISNIRDFSDIGHNSDFVQLSATMESTVIFRDGLKNRKIL